jgi:CubicO group peptidase (beta-lactamase class C family)
MSMLSQLFRIFQLSLFLALSGVPVAAGAAAEISDRLSRQMTINAQRYGIAGQAVLVSHNGKRLFRSVDGLADRTTRERVTEDDIFPVYSLSKLFVSTLILQLVEQGKVDLDRAASAYLPDLPPRWSHITVRQLLDHTSGLPEYFSPAQMTGTAEANASFPVSRAAVYAALADSPMPFAADAESRYTQTNYLVLSHLLEQHYGKPYPEIAAERIIDRLHLTHTFLGPEGLPKHGVVTAYIGKNDKLEKDAVVAWPRYAYGHAALYSSLGDLETFLRAVTSGELVGKPALRQFWQPRKLSNGQTGWFAGGWEAGESGGYRQVGHDGGARVRVRVLFESDLDGDVYTIIYLSSGSRRNVWTRVLVDSVMAVTAPQTFRNEALSAKLIDFALRTPDEKTLRKFADGLRAESGVAAETLERVFNNTGYAIRSNLGDTTALPVFKINALLYPASSNTWDSLAEAYEAAGDAAKAKAARQKVSALRGG